MQLVSFMLLTKMTVCPSNFFFPIHFHVTGNKMFQSNKMNQSIHCWGQSGGVRAGVPGHAVGLRVVSWWGGGFSLQALRGSVPCHGSGVQLQPSLPSPTVYIILGRVFLLSAVVLSFLTTFILVSFASQLFPRTRKHNLVSAFISFLTGASAFLALLLHALEIQNLRMKPSPPKFSVQWPYYVLGFAILLFIVAGAICLFQEAACLRCRLLPNSQSIQETQGVIHLENMESLGGDLSSIQKETLLKEETII
uniref:Transmembrane protein 225B n=1 Tax=Panthera leo TaxID=9689 RepID=A0A8C9DC53_PANLE